MIRPVARLGSPPSPLASTPVSTPPLDTLGTSRPPADVSMEDARRLLFGKRLDIGVNWVNTVETDPSRNPSQEQPAYSFAPMADGTLIVNGTRGTYAYRADGSVAWHLDTGYCPTEPAPQPDGTIYVNSRVDLNAPDVTSQLHCLKDRGQGMQIEWSRPISPTVFFTPTVGSDGRLYTTTGTNCMHVFGADGSDAGDFDIADMSPIRPKNLADGRLLVHATTNVLEISPNGDGGQPKVEKVYDTNQTWPVLVEKDGTTYLWDKRCLRCIEPDRKTERWNYDFGENFQGAWPQLSFAPDRSVYALTGEVPGGTTLFKLSPQGEFRWKWRPITGIAGGFQEVRHLDRAPIFDDEGTAYLSGAETIYAVDANGHEKWKNRYEESNNELRMGPHGTLVVSDPSTHLRVLDCKDGAQLWQSEFTMGHGYPGVFVQDETIYAGSKDCKLASVHIKDVLQQMLSDPPESEEERRKRDARIDQEPQFVVIDGVRVPKRQAPL